MKRLLAVALVCLSMGSRPVLAREFDAETGLVHMGARDYDPETARFLQEDPILEPMQMSVFQDMALVADTANRHLWIRPLLLFNPAQQHPYGYVANRPTRFIDPYGLGPVDDAGDFAAGFGDTLTIGGTRYLREDFFGIGGTDQTSGFYTAGGWTGGATGCGLGAAGTARGLIWAGRLGGAGKLNALGRWLHHGRYWRLSGSGFQKGTPGHRIPTLRIGEAQPPRGWNHIDLSVFGK